MEFSRRTLLQLIENMKIGGAQRSASSLLGLPGVDVHLATYNHLGEYAGQHFDAILLHVWCAERNLPIMNWPPVFDISFDQLVVFNHDWRGQLNCKADKYIVYSTFACANITANSRVYIVPGSIPTNQYKWKQIYSMPKPTVIGRLSTMYEGKISEELLHFWKDIPANRFIIGGDGPEREKVQTAYKQDPRFHFPGAIPPREVPQFLSQIDIFLYDTVWHIESFCYVVLEAMAAGCVVVAAEKGAIPELIKHGHTGFLYSSESQALAICRYLFQHPNVYSSVSRAAQKFALGYPLERFYDNILDVLDWQTEE